ncbi:MAG TPA: hypothetical protein VHP31_01920 [Caproicibacter sp.]|nr:hypothetical protein [Caproicibacter sp.]
MNDEKHVPHSDYSVDEILAEAKIHSKNDSKQKPNEAENKSEPQDKHRAAPLSADEIVHRARMALNMEAGAPAPAPARPAALEKKKRHSLFRRKQEEDDGSIPEDDIYYGLQLKSLDEYKREYENTIRFDTDELKAAEERARKAKEKQEAEKEAAQVPMEPDSAELSAEKISAEAPEIKTIAQEEPPEEPVVFDLPAEPERSSPAISVSSAAESTAEEIDVDRQDMLERILQHAGLDMDDIFGAEDAAPKPEPPGNPPRPTIPPLTRPPVPPAVEPGPAMEPEIKPPIVEPPLGPTQIPEMIPTTGESIGEPECEIEPEEPKPEEPQKESKEEKKRTGEPEIPTPEPTGETDADWETEPTGETEPTRNEFSAASAEKQTPVKEPVSAPPRIKDEAPAPAPVKEPSEHSIPQYRAGGIPLHIIELNGFEDALAAEAADYSTPPLHAPEPIPFPNLKQASGPDETPEQEEEAEPEETEVPGEPVQEDEIPGAVVLPIEQEREEISQTRRFTIPDETEEPKKAKKRFRLFGSDEDKGESSEESDGMEEELDDYTAPADAPSVMHDLSSSVRKLVLRFTVTGLCAVILTAFSIAWEHPAALPPALHSIYSAQAALAVHLIFLVIAAGFCAPAIWNGLKGLFSFQANADSAVSVAVIAAAVENVVFLVNGFPANCRLYSSLAALALFLNTAGKLSMAKRILKNFRFISSPEQKYAIQMFDDYNTAIQLVKGCGIGEPKIAYQTKTGFLRHFLKHSYSNDPSDHTSQFLAPAGFIGSLGLCITVAVLTKNPVTALTAFAASACVCVPFGNMLSVNLPLARLGKIASQCGGMTIGWDSVEKFSDTNAVMMDAQDLFPRGTVVLNGIQTFSGQRIDEAILDASALTEAAGGPLSDLFSQIVKSRGNILPHVERPSYEDGMGISGTVSDRVILVGTGELLKKHGVEAPSHDYEEKYIRAGKIPVYLASGGILVAMFLVSYRSDRRRAAELRRLEYNGISLLVRTRDPNITPELVADCFGLSPHSIIVLPERLGDIYESLQSNPPERASAVMATKGRAAAMMRMLTACVRQRGNITIGVAIQTTGAALGFALVAFFAAYAGLGQLTATALILFEAFWTAAVLFVPRIRKP